MPKSKLELERNLEQMRAMDNNLIIKVGLCDNNPLSVDTKDDLIKVSFKALVGATLASCMTGLTVGIFI